MNSTVTSKTPVITPFLLKVFTSLGIVEGVLALYCLFREPSQVGRAVLFGYSFSRLLPGLVILAVTILLAIGLLRLLRAERTPHRFLYDHLIIKKRLLPVCRLLGLTLLAIILILFLFASPYAPDVSNLPYTLPLYSVDEDVQSNILLPLTSTFVRAWSTLKTAADRLLPFLVWLLALALQALLFLAIIYHGDLNQQWKGYKKNRRASICFLLLMLAATLFHWMTLVLRLKTFLLIRGWKWYFWQKEQPPNLWVFPILLVGTLAIVFLVTRIRHRVWIALLLLILLGFGLQVGFGFISGNGFESLRLEYANSIFSYYAIEAAKGQSLYNALENYEEFYAPKGYLGTKPPGLLVAYTATQKLADLIHSEPTAEGRFFQATRLMAYLFPLLAMFTLPLLLILGSRLLGARPDAIDALVLYIVCPNVILITLFLDQMLYPLLFIGGLLLVQHALSKPSLMMGFLTGVYCYIALYFGFSLLPLLPMAFVWVLIDQVFIQRTKRWRETWVILFGILLGVVTAFFIFKWVLFYDFFARYQRAFEYHREIKEYGSGIRMICDAALLNNAEFITWTGVPLILLFLASAWRSLQAFLCHLPARADGLLASFLIIYAGLNIFGQTNGEVQRLWIFMVPLFALFSVKEITQRFGRYKNFMLLLSVVLQLVTTLLLFVFQDYYA